MLALIVTLTTITAILLVLVVLAQNSKGGGLSSQFGGSGSSQLMGVKRTTDLLEKITWGLAIGLVVLTLATNLIIKAPVSDSFSSPNIDRAQERNVLPSIDPNLESSDGELLGTDSAGSE